MKRRKKEAINKKKKRLKNIKSKQWRLFYVLKSEKEKENKVSNEYKRKLASFVRMKKNWNKNTERKKGNVYKKKKRYKKKK